MESEMTFDRGPAADLWRRTLSQIPTLFGRLAYLASLREPNSGAYRHYGLAQRFSDEDADNTLRHSHEELFAEWLASNLQRQKQDLDEYLAGLDEIPSRVIASWLSLTPYRNMMPASAREVERDLFTSDIRMLLELLRHEHAVALPDPDA